MRLEALILFMLAATCCGQTVTIDAPAGRLAQIDAEAGETASVIWEAREPIDLDYLQFGNVIVFDVDRPKTILSLTVVDWDAKSLVKKTFIVMADGTIPTPDPDDEDDKPDPPKPDPDDDKPLPSTDWNVGPAVRRSWAREGVSKSKAAKAADIFETHSQQMRELRGGSVAMHAKAIATELRTAEIPAAAIQAYADVMSEAANVMTLAEHAGAYQELADWMRK
jgi:hypothetical protein